MSDKKNRQTTDSKQTGPGLTTPRNGPKRSTDIKNFENGMGARPEATKND